MQLPEKNKKIISVLKENSQLSTSKISRLTNIPITTVHNRIKKMQKEGIIKKYTIVLDNQKLGKNILALILVNVNYKNLGSGNKSNPQETFRKILKYSCVEDVFELTGRYDLIVKVRTTDMAELNEFLTKFRNEPGVSNTETMMVLNEFSN